MKCPRSVKQQGPKLTRLVTTGREPIAGWGQGRAKGWKATRERILKRDGYLCQCHECKTAGRYAPASMVDHIDNRRGPGYDYDDNLCAINKQCHEVKTQLEAKIGRRLVKRPDWMKRETWQEGQ